MVRIRKGCCVSTPFALGKSIYFYGIKKMALHDRTSGNTDFLLSSSEILWGNQSLCVS